MIAYRANCPSCGEECWWHSTPVHTPNSGQSAVIDVKCTSCDKADRERQSGVVAQLTSTGRQAAFA